MSFLLDLLAAFPNQNAVTIAEQEAAKASSETLKSLIQYGIPGLATIAAGVIGYYAAHAGKKADKEIAMEQLREQANLVTKTAGTQSQLSLLELKRSRLETANDDFGLFESKVAQFIVQAVTRSKVDRTDTTRLYNVEQDLKTLDKESFDSFYEANRAKRTVSFVGFPNTETAIANTMSCAASIRKDVQASLSENNFIDVPELEEKLKEFRASASQCRREIAQNLDSLVVSS